MKYIVTLIYDASESVEVEAESVEAAIDAACDASEASLCWHCSRHLDLGDVYKEMVTDEEGNVIKDFDP